jgi:arylsulfatase A-like enzyme
MSTLFKTMDRFKQRDSEFYRAWVGHGFHVYEPLVHVPLIIYGPGLFPSGVEIAHLASHVDIFPTLVSAFDLPMANSSRVSGIDLTPIIQATDKKPDGRSIYLEASGERTRARPEQWLTALRTERYKYVRGLYNKTLPEELYDLEQDPAERENLVGKLPEVAEMLRARLYELLQEADEPQPDTATTYSPDEMAKLSQRLRDLGYVD